jgi:hypothetical protein
MQTKYEVWKLTEDQILEQTLDTDQMPHQYEDLAEAKAAAKNLSREEGIQETYLREIRTIETFKKSEPEIRRRPPAP